MSEISIPSEGEEEAPPVGLELEAEEDPEASTINNNKEQNGKEDEKEALPSSQWTMEEEKVEKETPTEGTEPGADGVLPLGPDSRFPEDREERVSIVIHPNRTSLHSFLNTTFQFSGKKKTP